MKRSGVLLLAVLLLGMLPEPVPAQPEMLQAALPKGIGSKLGEGGAFLLNGPVDIDADDLSYDEENGIAVAEGNVEITLGPRKMRADRISYNFRTGEADLTGKVRYKDADEQFSFDRITLNLGTETGILYNGTILISTNNYLISGEKIEKTGKQSFRVDKGSITTCPCDPKPDWEFDVRRARIEIDGYAVSKDITVRLQGVPVFWMPYAVFPVKLSRQSGLLLPSISTSRSRGFTFSLPYYWAINRWSDATITIDAMTKRGIRPEVEYRFVPNLESEGAIRGNFIHDKETHHDRWRVYGENVYHAGDWTGNARVEIPSDNQYYVDYEVSDKLRSARHTFSTGFVGWSGENTSQQLAVTWVEEMEWYPTDNTLQRLPEYHAALLPYRTPVGGIEASGEMSATYFYRKEGDRADRARGSMTLARTFVPYPSVSLSPYASAYVLGTHYQQVDEWGNAGRLVPVTGVQMAAEAQRSFLDNGSGFVHVVGSDIGYRHVYRKNQDDMPIYDQWSRLAAQDQVVFTITQRLLRMQEAASPRDVASMILEWAYDFNGRETSDTPYVDPLSPFVRVLRDQIDLGGGKPQQTGEASDVYGKIIVRPIEHWRLEGEALFDPGDASFSMAAVGGGWEKDVDHKFGLAYRVTRDLAEDIRASFAWRPLHFLKLHADVNYSLRNSELTDGTAGLTLTPKSDCWSIGFTTVWNSHPTDTSYRLVFGLKGIGTAGEKKEAEVSK